VDHHDAGLSWAMAAVALIRMAERHATRGGGEMGFMLCWNPFGLILQRNFINMAI
jgi:hypothetical protein